MIKLDYYDEDVQPGGEKSTVEHQDQIEIPQWIADKFILMDYFNEDGPITNPVEILRLSVINCPELEEFIIETKLDNNTCLFTGEALIDRQLVGRASASTAELVEQMAAENALQNLKKKCFHIEIKQSYYFGSNGELPVYLRRQNPSSTNNIYRVVEPFEASIKADFSKILVKFRNSNMQDLFFLENFKLTDRELVSSMVKKKRLLAWQFGNKCVCVYKNRRPGRLYNELLLTSGQNEKFRIIPPSEKVNKFIPAENQEKCGNKDLQLQNLFDFEKQSINPAQQIKAKPNRTVPSFWGNHKNRVWTSQSYKRSYAKGPGSSEEQTPGCSRLSHSSHEHE